MRVIPQIWHEYERQRLASTLEIKSLACATGEHSKIHMEQLYKLNGHLEPNKVRY